MGLGVHCMSSSGGQGRAAECVEVGSECPRPPAPDPVGHHQGTEDLVVTGERGEDSLPPQGHRPSTELGASYSRPVERRTGTSTSTGRGRGPGPPALRGGLGGR